MRRRPEKRFREPLDLYASVRGTEVSPPIRHHPSVRDRGTEIKTVTNAEPRAVRRRRLGDPEGVQDLSGLPEKNNSVRTEAWAAEQAVRTVNGAVARSTGMKTPELRRRTLDGNEIG